MKRAWEITYNYRSSHRGDVHTYSVVTQAEGPMEALRKFARKLPFRQVVKLEAFPKGATEI